MSASPVFARMALVGSGLIGCSFALALRKADRVAQVVACDRDIDVARRAMTLGIVDAVERDVGAAVAGCDFVVVAAPVAQTESILSALASRLMPGALITDVGSTKQDVIASARRALGVAVAQFVPGHPIAGREVHGPDAARVDLFEGKRVLLTPLPENDDVRVERLRDAWTACGARVQSLDARAHDEVLSAVSHLPHVLAYALVAQIADASDADLKFALAGGSFRDFTRIAASSPEMWRDVALANRDALLRDLDEYSGRLDTLRRWIAAGDGEALRGLFARASEARQRWQDVR